MQNRVALITGGSTGIGAACARSLAASGHRVALTYRTHREEAVALAGEIGAVAYEVEIADPIAVRALAERVAGELGPVQVLVLNAGLIRDSLLAFLSESDWDAVFDVNLRGHFVLTKAVLKGMLRSRWGRIVSVASLSGLSGQVGQAHYSAAKAGLIAFTKTVAREVAAYGVTANAVAPGFIDTSMLAGLSEAKLREYVEGIPLKRLGRPEEVAALVAFLASDDAAYITGQTLRIDGGLITA